MVEDPKVKHTDESYSEAKTKAWAKSVFGMIVVLAVLGDIVIAMTGAGFLVHSEEKKVVIWEGDIQLPVELAPKTGDVSKPKDAVYCTYWRGFYTTRMDFPARLGCPPLLPS